MVGCDPTREDYDVPCGETAWPQKINSCVVLNLESTGTTSLLDFRVNQTALLGKMMRIFCERSGRVRSTAERTMMFHVGKQHGHKNQLARGIEPRIHRHYQFTGISSNLRPASSIETKALFLQRCINWEDIGQFDKGPRCVSVVEVAAYYGLEEDAATPEEGWGFIGPAVSRDGKLLGCPEERRWSNVAFFFLNNILLVFSAIQTRVQYGLALCNNHSLTVSWVKTSILPIAV